MTFTTYKSPLRPLIQGELYNTNYALQLVYTVVTVGGVGGVEIRVLVRWCSYCIYSN